MTTVSDNKRMSHRKRKHIYWSGQVDAGIQSGDPVRALCGYSKVITRESAAAAHLYEACGTCTKVARKRYSAEAIPDWTSPYVTYSYAVSYAHPIKHWKSSNR